MQDVSKEKGNSVCLPGPVYFRFLWGHLRFAKVLSLKEATSTSAY